MPSIQVNLEETFAPARATYDVNVNTNSADRMTAESGDKTSGTTSGVRQKMAGQIPLFLEDAEDEVIHDNVRTMDLDVDQSTDIATLGTTQEPDANEENDNGTPVAGAFGEANALLRTSEMPQLAVEDPKRQRSPQPVPAQDRTPQEDEVNGPHDIRDRESANASCDMSPRIIQIPPPRSLRGNSSRTSSGGSSAATELSGRQTSAQIHNAQAARSRSVTTNINNVSYNVRVPSDAKDVQMTLSTANASWKLRPREADDDGRISKKARLDSSTRHEKSQSAREGLRDFLQKFASTSTPASSQHDTQPLGENDDIPPVLDADMDVDEDQEDDGDLSMNAEQRSPPAGIDNAGGVSDTRSKLKSLADSASHVTSISAPNSGSLNPPMGEGELIDLTQDTGSLPSPSFSSILSDDENKSSGSRITEVIRTDNDEVSLSFSLPRISAFWTRLQEQLSRSTTSNVAGPIDLTDGIGTSDLQDAANAEQMLSRTIEKSDFGAMNVVGQFNRGFIIVRRQKSLASVGYTVTDRSTTIDDLFIVDQHAADEKYNFETLQQTTRIESQKLFR